MIEISFKYVVIQSVTKLPNSKKLSNFIQMLKARQQIFVLKNPDHDFDACNEQRIAKDVCLIVPTHTCQSKQSSESYSKGLPIKVFCSIREIISESFYLWQPGKIYCMIFSLLKGLMQL